MKIEKQPKRCLFCNKEFDKDERPESVKAEGRPRQYFHYRCYESWKESLQCVTRSDAHTRQTSA